MRTSRQLNRYHHHAAQDDPYLPEPERAPGPPSSRELRDLKELIATVHATAGIPGREIDALIAEALELDPRFSSRLALRALRLEQALRETQERAIVLQWELSQALRRERALSRAAGTEPRRPV